RMAEDNAKAQLSIYQQQTQEGYHTQSESIQREIEVESQLYGRKIVLYSLEEAAAGQNAQAHLAANNKLTQAETEYTDLMLSLADKRNKAIIAEGIAAQANALAVSRSLASVQIAGRNAEAQHTPLYQQSKVD